MTHCFEALKTILSNYFCKTQVLWEGADQIQRFLGTFSQIFVNYDKHKNAPKVSTTKKLPMAKCLINSKIPGTPSFENIQIKAVFFLWIIS